MLLILLPRHPPNLLNNFFTALKRLRCWGQVAGPRADIYRGFVDLPVVQKVVLDLAKYPDA